MGLKPFRVLFTVFSSAGIGVLLYALTADFAVVKYAAMAVGLMVGFFLSQIILDGKFKVFDSKRWIKLAIVIAAAGLSLVLTILDPLQIVRWTPDPEDVQSVVFSKSHITRWWLESFDERQSELYDAPPYDIYDGVILTRDMHISPMIEIHKLLAAEEEISGKYDTSMYTPVTVRYYLKNGVTITRYYYAYDLGEAKNALDSFIKLPEYILGVSDINELKAGLKHMEYSTWMDGRIDYEITGQWAMQLLDAMYQDAKEGNLRLGIMESPDNYIVLKFITWDGKEQQMFIGIRNTAENTRKVIGEYLNTLT